MTTPHTAFHYVRPDEVAECWNGVLAAGKRADLCIWNAQHPAELSYRIGATPLHTRMFGGHFDA